MTRCYDEGLLRSYLDNELTETRRTEVATHLAGCERCREQLAGLRALASQTGTILRAWEPVPSPEVALARLRLGLPEVRLLEATTITNAAGRPVAPPTWRSSMHTAPRPWSGQRRWLVAGLTAVVLAGLFMLPPVRAAADQLLQVFRVQRVVFMPISPERIEQLSELNVDEDALFIAEPTITNDPASPEQVASPAEASASAGFMPRVPSDFPTAPLSTEFSVHDAVSVEFQVDVDGARQLLALLDVRDVTLPDALGAEPIRANVPRWVESRYRGENYEARLIQGPSPEVTLPEGVELAGLGKAALRLLGMPPNQADALSRQIDWSSTLVFPFPQSMTGVRQITVDGESALLIGDEQGSRNTWQIYWQKDGRFYVLETRGNVQDLEAIVLAESIQ